MRQGKLKIILILIILLNFGTRVMADTPDRVISLAPNITEIIFKLQAAERLVGRTEFGTFPPTAREVESVGGYLNTNYEKIVQLQPDLILQLPNAESRRKLQQLGFRVEEIPDETIHEILAGITKIGRLLHREKQAQKIRQGIEDTLRMVQEWAAAMPDSIPAILVVGRQPGSLKGLYLAGSRTYLSELWNLCGGINAFGEVSARYFSVNKEDLLKRPIQAILEFHPGWQLTPERIRKEHNVWEPFGSLEAVRKSNIYLFSDYFFVIPGPRISQIAIKFYDIAREIQRKNY